MGLGSGVVFSDGITDSFADVWLEPKPFRADRPRLWFGGMSVGPWIVRRLVEYGHGFHPFGQPGALELRSLADALAAAGRDFSELEVVGGIRGRFPPAGEVADLDEATEAIPAQLEAGYTTICFKPSQYTDDPVRTSGGCAVSWSGHSGAENSAVRSTTVLTSA